MQTLASSERFVNIYQTTRRHIPEVSDFHTSRHENLNILQNNPTRAGYATERPWI
jgi:hypothetical protein